MEGEVGTEETQHELALTPSQVDQEIDSLKTLYPVDTYYLSITGVTQILRILMLLI